MDSDLHYMVCLLCHIEYTEGEGCLAYIERGKTPAYLVRRCRKCSKTAVYTLTVQDLDEQLQLGYGSIICNSEESRLPMPLLRYDCTQSGCQLIPRADRTTIRRWVDSDQPVQYEVQCTVCDQIHSWDLEPSTERYLKRHLVKELIMGGFAPGRRSEFGATPADICTLLAELEATGIDEFNQLIASELPGGSHDT